MGHCHREARAGIVPAFAFLEGFLRFFSGMGKSGRNASRNDGVLIVLCVICARSLMCLEFQGRFTLFDRKPDISVNSF